MTAPGHSSPSSSGTGQEADGLAPTTDLVRQPQLLFGSPVPRGLTLVSEDDDIVRLNSFEPLNRLVAFYRRELRGWDERIDATGAAFETNAPDRADIYLAQIDPTTVEVLYLRSGLEAEFQTAFRAELQGSSATLPFARQYPWLQGYTAPDEMVEEIRQRQLEPERTGYYDERLEEREGQTVRVLVPRNTSIDPASSGEEEGTDHVDGPRVGPRHSYPRQDAFRSLRPAPTRGIDGQALPFFGTRQLELPGADGSR